MRYVEDFTPRKFRGLRLMNGLTQLMLTELSGVSRHTLRMWEHGKATPREYSLRAAVKVLGGIEALRDQPDEDVNIRLKRSTPKLVATHKTRKESTQLVHTFKEGQCYSISDASRKQGDSFTRLSCEGLFVLRYEGKQGIHHHFRETRGGWTRTYTDAQLVGKRIQEATE